MVFAIMESCFNSSLHWYTFIDGVTVFNSHTQSQIMSLAVLQATKSWKVFFFITRPTESGHGTCVGLLIQENEEGVAEVKKAIFYENVDIGNGQLEEAD